MMTYPENVYGYSQRIKHQLDVTCYFISLLMYSTCFGHEYIHHQAEACNTDTTPTQPHQISNTQRTKNKRTNVVIQQHSRKLLMMDILMSETCWVHKKWNETANDIKSVFHSSAITMTQGPINIIVYGYLTCEPRKSLSLIHTNVTSRCETFYWMNSYAFR